MKVAELLRPTGAVPEGRAGWIVAGSLATGLLAGLALVAAPFVPAQEDAVTGALLCGFAVGWAMVAVLSARCTDQPQRWAAVPAAFMGLSGLLLIGFGPQVRDVLDGIWPPALLRGSGGLRVRRQLHSPATGCSTRCSRCWCWRRSAAATRRWREAADAAAYPMPGQLIDVGGHRLHLHCTGSGSPTVVLEPGGGRDVVEPRVDHARGGP